MREISRIHHGLVGVLLVMTAVSGYELSIPCPPSFIDMESFFAKTLQQNEQMREMFHTFKSVNSQPDNCKYSWDILGNLQEFNDERCERDEDTEVVCTTTTTSTTTTTTTTTAPEPPSSPPTEKTGGPMVPPELPSTSLSSSSTSRGPVLVTTAPPRPVPSPSQGEDGSTATRDGNEDATTKSRGVTIPDADSVVGPKPEDNGTIIYICLGIGVLLIIVVVSLVVVCRNHSAASGGAKKNLQRQRSDLTPIKSIQDDMSRRSSMSGDGSWRYARSVKRANNVWRPNNYSSESGSEHGSMKSTKFLLAREDSHKSMSSDFHFNTLKHLDHPNAIVLGGFGETSTDFTLSKNGTLPNGTLPNGTLPNGKEQQDMAVLEITAETMFNYDNPKICGYDNPSMSKSSSFDSVDRALDDWKKSVKDESVPVDDDLVNSQNELMFCYENKALEADSKTPAVAPTPNDTVHTSVEVEVHNPITVPDPPATKPALNPKPVLDPKVVDVHSPAPNVAVVLPTKRPSVKEMKSMFESGNKQTSGTSTLQAQRGTNGVLQNGLNNKFNSLPRNLEKPSAHVPPQPAIIADRDADVQL